MLEMKAKLNFLTVNQYVMWLFPFLSAALKNVNE
jgi:hypothetical protein